MAIILGPPPSTPSTVRGNVYLPIVAGSPDPVAAFCRLLVGDSRQQRPTLELCGSLQQASIWRAHGLACGGAHRPTVGHRRLHADHARRWVGVAVCGEEVGGE